MGDQFPGGGRSPDRMHPKRGGNEHGVGELEAAARGDLVKWDGGKWGVLGRGTVREGADPGHAGTFVASGRTNKTCHVVGGGTYGWEKPLAGRHKKNPANFDDCGH